MLFVPDTRAILLAEDSEDDVLLIRRVFDRINSGIRLQLVGNGEEAIAYLKGIGRYANREQYPMPGLLLLDLKMPRKNGFEVLEWIKSNPSLRFLRVIVLTTSRELRDVNRAYQLGATSFLVKPADFEKTLTIVRALKDYWLLNEPMPEIGPGALDTLIPPPASPSQSEAL